MRIDGKAIALGIEQETMKKLNNSDRRDSPRLAIINVGDNIESATYIRLKMKKCESMGIKTSLVSFPIGVTESMLINTIKNYNSNNGVHGILVQLPLPPSINTRNVLNEISVNKDVDGLTHENMGRLVLNDNPKFVGCTGKAIMKVLEHYHVNLEGLLVVVIGTSNLVGMPVSIMLRNARATVIMCNSKTKNLKKLTGFADIIITACGVPELVTGEWITPDAIVIDVGINKKIDILAPRGYRLVGDVHYESVSKVAKLVNKLTIGPITIAVLLSQTVKSWEQQKRTKGIFNNFLGNYSMYL